MINVPVRRLGLTELADWIKDGNSTIEELPINGHSFRWLADFLIVIAKLPESVNRRPLIDGLIPDQHSRFRRTKEVRIEIDISDAIKDIACEVGIDLRARLAHRDLIQALDEPGYEPARDLIEEMLGQDYTENEAIDEVLQTLEDKLPDGHQVSEAEDFSYLRTAADMAAYLTQEDNDTQRLRRCPLLTAEDKIVRLENNSQILAPVAHWKETQRPYANLYRKNRIISNRYVDDGSLSRSLKALIDKYIVIPAPLYWSRRGVLEGDLLRTMVPSDADTDGLAIRNQSFGQIAFLSSEVVNRCGRSKDLAKKLLDFVLNVAVKEDPHWIDTTLRSCSGADRDLQLPVHQSTWPFELKIRSWVPLPVEDDTFAPGPANEDYLRDLLEPVWLQDNQYAVDLLNRVFGFRQLTLMLESLDGDAEVEDGLVRLLQEPDLVKSAAADIDMVRIAVEDPEVRAFVQDRKLQSDVRNRNRDFGLAVQEAVKEAVESLGLDLHLVDSGYDYEVFPDNSSFSFEVGSYYLEVKATVSGDVRLTPKQARTAGDNSDRFVLCVVDLSDVPDASSKMAWRADDVFSRAKMVTDMGGYFRDIYEGIASFTKADQLVRLRNEGLLRYGVSKDLWKNGVAIDRWVESLR